jgi:GT2 family glycosyltransferase
LDLERPAEVEQPAGAFLMLRREVWHELGGFDEGFHPLWFEDVDFARRARNRGYRFLYTPLAVAAHRGGYSAEALNWESKQQMDSLHSICLSL